MSDKDKPFSEFPKNKPEKSNLNDDSIVPAPAKRKGKKEGKASKIEEVERFLSDRYEFRYNTVKNGIEYRLKTGNKWQDVDERMSLKLESELLYAGYNGIARPLHVFLTQSPDFDPVNDYLKGLSKWEGKTDFIGQLASFVKVEPGRRAWFDSMFKKHLIRTLASLTGRIPFNKQCFVLVSGQNDGKTSFLRHLCPPNWKEYYTEDIDFESKDGLTALARNIFINLDELRNLSRKDINSVKSFLSKDTVKALLPFDRRETKMKRHASFFGSTNNPEFLTDETGSVRWLVFEILGINHDNGGKNGYEKQVDINKVWAQAYALVQRGETGQLTPQEIQLSEAYNKDYAKPTPEYEFLIKYLDEVFSDNEPKTASEIAKILSDKTGTRLTAETMGKALKQAGINAYKKKINGCSMKVYQPKT